MAKIEEEEIGYNLDVIEHELLVEVDADSTNKAGSEKD
jgi:hypothetical protein